MMISVALVLAQAGAADAAGSVKIGSIWDFLVKGGPLMVPLAAVSLIALAVTIERAISLRRNSIIPPRLIPDIDARRASGGPDGRRRAIEYCKAVDSVGARVAGAVLQHAADPADVRLENIQRVCERELRTLHKYERVLPLIIAISPMLGLLGTITGMIQAFSTVASSAEALGRTELLAKGIYEAMITTAVGLMIAIPAMIAQHWVSGRVHRLTLDLDDMAAELLSRVREERAVVDAPAKPSRSAAVEEDIEPSPAAMPGASAALEAA